MAEQIIEAKTEKHDFTITMNKDHIGYQCIADLTGVKRGLKEKGIPCRAQISHWHNDKFMVMYDSLWQLKQAIHNDGDKLVSLTNSGDIIVDQADQKKIIETMGLDTQVS